MCFAILFYTSDSGTSLDTVWEDSIDPAFAACFLNNTTPFRGYHINLLAHSSGNVVVPQDQCILAPK